MLTFRIIRHASNVRPENSRNLKFLRPKNDKKKNFSVPRDSDEDVHSRRFKAFNEGQQIKIRYLRRFVDVRKLTPINLQNLKLVKLPDNPQTFNNIPRLQHGLQFVIKGGIHNHDFGLGLIPHPDEVEMNLIDQYVPPSGDNSLLSLAKKNNLRFMMSTSTISAVLGQMYFLYSRFRHPNFDLLGRAFDNEPQKYMISFRKPVTLILKKQDTGVYSLDSDQGYFIPVERILMDLGKVIETQLTTTKQEFANKYKKPSKQSDIKRANHYRNMFVNDELCLRSQIDSYSLDQNQKPFVFQIKTRATSPIRYDLYNFYNYLDYSVRYEKGLTESFERQYYDLIRGGFIKYAFQLFIGDMDGALIAYHNTQRIFGFQYVKNKQIYNRIFSNSFNAEMAFLLCCKMLTNSVNVIMEQLKNIDYKYLRLGFYASNTNDSLMMFAEVINQELSAADYPLNDEVKDELDYFTKVKKFTNKVYKFEFKYYMFVNGALIVDPAFLLQEGDHIQMRFSYQRNGLAEFVDYMNFLHDAYKFDNVNGDYNYSGVWTKNMNLFHYQ